jgi:hypothetical protein
MDRPQQGLPATAPLPHLGGNAAFLLRETFGVASTVSTANYRLLRQMLLPALLPFALSGCPLWWKGDPIAHAELQAFAPARSAGDVTRTLDHMLTSLGTKRSGNDKSIHNLNAAVIAITTEERPAGTIVCIEHLGATGATQVDDAVVKLFAKLRLAMEADFGNGFVTDTPCSAPEPYWPGGDGA